MNRLKVMFLGSTHGFYHGMMLVIALAVLEIVYRIAVKVGAL